MLAVVAELAAAAELAAGVELAAAAELDAAATAGTFDWLLLFDQLHQLQLPHH